MNNHGEVTNFSGDLDESLKTNLMGGKKKTAIIGVSAFPFSRGLVTSI